MSIGTSVIAPALDVAAPILPAGALPGLLVLVPLSVLWLGALVHCGLVALRALRAPVAQNQDGNKNESEQEAPLTWLLVLILGSFVAALVYVGRELWIQRTGRRAGAAT
jgi:hypothetical protein